MLTIPHLYADLDASIAALRADAGRVAAARDVVEGALGSRATYYGINTGFGARLMLRLKVHALGLGHSGVSPTTIDRLLTFAERDLVPVMPSRGSLGASGDLAPLAHLALPLLGRGRFWDDDGKHARPAAEVLAEHDLDGLVAPSQTPAFLVDAIHGANFNGETGAGWMAAIAGYPHLTVPMGAVESLPVGLSFMAGNGRDGAVLAMGYDYEQRSFKRITPRFLPNAEANDRIANAMSPLFRQRHLPDGTQQHRLSATNSAAEHHSTP